MKSQKDNQTNKTLKYIFKIPTLFIKYFIIGLKYLLLTFPLFIKRKIIDKNKSPKKIISLSILLLSSITYLVSVFILTRWFIQNERNKNFIDSLMEQETYIIKEETQDQYNDTNNINTIPNNNNNSSTDNYVPNFININLNYYINKNKETVGWIKIDNTKINYPIVQHQNNIYYLEHDFYNKKTDVGWIFADYRNNFHTLENNTIIYGHNLIDKYMFGNLPDFLNKKWLNDQSQQYIKLQTRNQNTIWQIFSVYKIEPTTDYLQTRFGSIESYQNFLTTIKNRSIHNLNIEVDYTDKILTLSTCDNTGKYRVVVHAKLIKIQ